MSIIHAYKLEIIVFITGAAVMILELTGSRVLAPYIGTSVVVWTSLIGVILTSLSLGYWWGGKIADRMPKYEILAKVIFFSGVYIGITALVKDLVLFTLSKLTHDLRISSLAATILLFGFPSILLGFVSPYAVKMKMADLTKSGSVAGTLYAISTAGSIVGTFLAGFILMSYLGNTRIFLFLAATLIATSFLAMPKIFSAAKIASFLVFFIFLFGLEFIQSFGPENKLTDIDTPYNRYFIFDTIDGKTGKLARVLQSFVTQSSMFLNDDELVEEFFKFFRLSSYFAPGAKKALMVGGAAYSYPKDFLQKNPEAKLDVVEIDPGVTEIAKKYFNLKNDSRLKIFHEDGRIFLNRALPQSYDVVFIDAFHSSFSVPYHLTTKETVQKIYDALDDNGAVLVNILSAIEGKRGGFLRAEYKTYRAVFPQVFLFPVNHKDNGQILQNILLVGLKERDWNWPLSNNAEFDNYLGHRWLKEVIDDVALLTDDYAPVDSLMANAAMPE